MVTITVTNVDEAPKISVGGLAITGVARMDYAENARQAWWQRTRPPGRMSANATMWSLEGDDAGDFSDRQQQWRAHLQECA